jgi:hypothetical protein
MSQLGRAAALKTSDKLSVYEKLNANYYETKLQYPTKPKKPSTTIDISTASDDDVFQARLALGDYNSAVAKYDADLKRFRDDEARLHQEFRDDLEREFGMKGHPKADLLYSKASDRGYDEGGRYEVYQAYLDLIDLVR